MEQEASGVFTVLRGQAAPEELAAVVAAVLTLAAGSGGRTAAVRHRAGRPHWQARRRVAHARGRHVPAAAWTGVTGTGAAGPWPGPGR
jgi:hypothetical protein